MAIINGCMGLTELYTAVLYDSWIVTAIDVSRIYGIYKAIKYHFYLNTIKTRFHLLETL